MQAINDANPWIVAARMNMPLVGGISGTTVRIMAYTPGDYSNIAPLSAGELQSIGPGSARGTLRTEPRIGGHC